MDGVIELADGVVYVADRRALAELLRLRGTEHGLHVFLPPQLPRLADVVPMNNTVTGQKEQRQWEFDGDDLLAALVPLASTFRAAVDSLRQLLQATVPEHLRFEKIEEAAQKLREAGLQMEVEVQAATNGQFHFAAGGWLEDIGNHIVDLADNLRVSPGLLRQDILTAKWIVDQVYEHVPVVFGAAAEDA